MTDISRHAHFSRKSSHHRKGTVVAPGIPLGLTGTPGRTRDAGRARGHDNREVFCELLGLSAEEFANYLEGGVIEAADA